MGSKALAACAARFVCAVPALLAAACAGTNIEPEPVAPKGLACVDDSRQCVEQRMTVLKGLMSDRDKRWVREPATPEAYASGVRLFAFKGRKKDLNCDELAIGKREADAGPAVLRGASSRLTPAQISRGAMLSGEVGKELGVEMRRRCKA
jgi:hypothetical protein